MRSNMRFVDDGPIDEAHELLATSGPATGLINTATRCLAGMGSYTWQCKTDGL